MFPVLHTDQLTKRYGGRAALDRVDLSVGSGQVFGLLGPNGSGKTTLLSILLDVVRPDSGGFTWFGGAPPRNNPRRRIGALLETPNFLPYLDAKRNLALVASIKRSDRATLPALIDRVGLSSAGRTPFRAFSLGMKQRLALAACLVGNPDVLIFDEPTNGLDPTGMIEVRDLLRGVAAEGKTILLASHMLDEVEKVCSHVGILKNGRLLASGPVGSILSDDRTAEIACAPADIARLAEIITVLPQVKSMRRDADRLLIDASREFDAATVNRAAFDAGITLTHLVVRARSLEHEFLEITRQQ